MKSRGPLDLVEEQEGYGEVFLSTSSGEIWTVESKSTGAIGSLTRSHLGVS
jgi:hypothetical protein